MIELPKYTVPTYNPLGLAENERTDFTRRIPALPEKQLARDAKIVGQIVRAYEQGVGIAIYEDDSPMTRKVKEFMAMYGIIDIKMRMLKIVELKRIMGFPEDYALIGTQAEQKKFIGNAVEVNMSRVLCETLARRLMDKAA